MKSLLQGVYFLLVFTVLSKAQQVPDFISKPITISVPSFLPGIMADESAIINNDTLSYSLQGQLFTKGYKVQGTRKHTQINSPWALIFEMADAYGQKDIRKIIGLYDEISHDKITNLLSGNESAAFFKFITEAVHSNFRILGGMEYKKGFLVYTADDKYGIHSNYMIKEGDRYKLSTLEDSSSTAWNIGLYFKFNPGPAIPVKNVVMPDSISLSGTMTIIAIVPEPMRWVAAYFGAPGEPIKMLVQDNGVYDLDPQKKVVRFQIPASVFPMRGKYNFYITSFNFPAQKISRNFFIPEAMHIIKVY